MSILPRTLATCEACKEIYSPEFSLSSAHVAVPFGHIRWEAECKNIYLIITQKLDAVSSITIGAADNGGTRTTADADYFVASYQILFSHEVGSVITMTVANSLIQDGEVVTFTSDGTPSSTGKCIVQFCYEYHDESANDEPTAASTSTTTTTSTSTSTSTTTTTA